ncbi:MAG: SprB repeat-containing protein, partial [Bacteroidota bacterium]
CTISTGPILFVEDFEDTLCCPDIFTTFPPTGIYCLDSPWELVHLGTADFYNTCGFIGDEINNPLIPLPIPSGNACIGMISDPFYREGIATCLPFTLMADSNYTLEFYMGFPDSYLFDDSSPVDYSLYGMPQCPDLPQPGFNCLESNGWEEIVRVTAGGPAGTWMFVSENFMPDQDYNALAFAASCDTFGYFSFYNFLDELSISGAFSANPIDIDSIRLAGDCVSGYTLNIDDVNGASYQWYQSGIAINGATESSLIIDAPYQVGSYQVRITSSDGCVISDPFLFQADLEVLDFEAIVSDETCPTQNDGEILITTNFQNEPVVYDWSIGSSNNALDNLSPDQYTVTITDANGCFTDSTFIIEAAESIESSIENVVNPTQANPLGSATLNVNGGALPYFYSWSNGEIGETATGLLPGLNYVTLTDGNGCEIIDSIFIAEVLNVNEIIQNPPCANLCLGSIELIVSGGIADYSYNWSID